MLLEMSNSYKHINKIIKNVKTHFLLLVFTNISLLPLWCPKKGDPLPNGQTFLHGACETSLTWFLLVTVLKQRYIQYSSLSEQK